MEANKQETSLYIHKDGQCKFFEIPSVSPYEVNRMVREVMSYNMGEVIFADSKKTFHIPAKRLLEADYVAVE